jgi:type IV secretory pathway VirB4 component
VLSPNVAVWTHVLRRRERTSQLRFSASGFAAELHRKYQDHLSGETLMINEVFLSLARGGACGEEPGCPGYGQERHQQFGPATLVGASPER